MKYIVKLTYTTSYDERQYVYYFGKGGYSTKNLTDEFVSKYGYSRESAAQKNYHYQNPKDEVFYKKSAEIIEVA